MFNSIIHPPRDVKFNVESVNLEISVKIGIIWDGFDILYGYLPCAKFSTISRVWKTAVYVGSI